MADTIKCKALTVFTEFVAERGMVHGDPASTIAEAREPDVPVEVVAKLVDLGYIADPKGGKAKKSAGAQAPADDEAPVA